VKEGAKPKPTEWLILSEDFAVIPECLTRGDHMADCNFPTENQDNAADLVTRKANSPSSNGKLTAELFTAGGILVTDTAVVKDDGLTRSQPILPISKAEILRQGREALDQLLSRGHDWTYWKKLLPVLDLARTTAMLEAGTNKPQGRRYCDALGKWFRCHDEFALLGKLDKSIRARFYDCFSNLVVIDEWRAGLPVEKQLELNYPSTVLKHWRRSTEPRKKEKKEKKTPRPNAAGEEGETSRPAWETALIETSELTDLDWTALFASRTYDWWLQTMPAAFQEEMEKRLLNRQASQNSLRKSKNLRPVPATISTALRRAFSLIQAADATSASEIQAKASTNDAISTLRSVINQLRNVCIEPAEIDIVANGKHLRVEKKSRKRRAA
jgi:hypothetical protein